MSDYLSGLRRSVSGVMDLFTPLNKARNQYEESLDEGVSGNYMAEMTLDMDDEDLLDLDDDQDTVWTEYNNRIKPKQDMNEDFWLGAQNDPSYYNDATRDNLIFEAVETFLPLITATNPEPLVYSANTQPANTLCNTVKEMISFQMDRLVIRQKVRKMARDWSLDYIGCLQVGWDPDEDDISTERINPRNLKLDPNGWIDENGIFTGEWIKKKVKTTGSKLVKMFPEHAAYIFEKCEGKLGTSCVYTENWTDDYLYFRFKKKILMKLKNPHFNYQERMDIDPETGEQVMISLPGDNHFTRPAMPFVFLGVYTLGTQPHDITNPVEQNIPLQRRINKRNLQLDQNIDSMNNGIAMSGNSFNKEQAAQGANALRKGNPLYVPKGDIDKAYREIRTPALPGDVYNSLEDARAELKNIFGIAGSTPESVNDAPTVRQGIMSRQFDSTRNSFPIEAIEQVYDRTFNWWAQLFKVYYDVPKTAAIIGNNQAIQSIELSSQMMNEKISISVREGSLLPKDDISQANQAITMAQEDLLDRLSLYEKLDFPDPIETYTRWVLQSQNPMALVQQGAVPTPAGQPEGNADSAPPQGGGADAGEVNNTPPAVDISSVPIQHL